MTIARPTKPELFQQLQATVYGLDSSLVVSKDSDAGIKILMLVEALFGVHYNVEQVFKDVFVTNETSTEALDLHAQAKLPGGRKGASSASTVDCLDITGTAGSIASIGDTLSSTNGSQYVLSSGATLDANGEGTCSVESTTKGTAANRDSGEVLTFTTPASGINASATLNQALTGAVDTETDGELLARLQDAYANPPGDGRLSAFRQWAAAVPGVASAYSYGPSSSAQTGRRGIGIVDVAILRSGSGADRIPGQALADEVDDYIEARRPGTTREHSVLIPTPTATDVDAIITEGVGFEADWQKASAVQVTSWTEATMTLVVDDESATFSNAAKPLEAGDRILVNGEVATIKTVTDGTGTCTIVLTSITRIAANGTTTEEETFENDPTATDDVWPAGTLTVPMLYALRSLFDQLGPARGVAFDPEQDWNSSLKLAAIDQVLMNVNGVKNVDIQTPLVDDDAADAAPSGSVELLIWGVLTVRPALVP